MRVEVSTGHVSIEVDGDQFDLESIVTMAVKTLHDVRTAAGLDAEATR